MSRRVSQQAISIFQRYAGLDPDGIDGPKTLEALSKKGYSDIESWLMAEKGLRLDTQGDPNWARALTPHWRDTVAGVSGSFIPQGVMIHHTGGSGDHVNEKLLREGRKDLRGPLCQVAVNRDGSIVCITNGRAQHAGKGCADVLLYVQGGVSRLPPRDALIDNTYGNSHFLGLEIHNSGEKGETYPVEQMQSVYRVVQLWLSVFGWGPARVIGHKEWTARKVDPSFDMDAFRASLSQRPAQPEQPEQQKQKKEWVSQDLYVEAEARVKAAETELAALKEAYCQLRAGARKIAEMNAKDQQRLSEALSMLAYSSPPAGDK